MRVRIRDLRDRHPASCPCIGVFTCTLQDTVKAKVTCTVSHSRGDHLRVLGGLARTVGHIVIPSATPDLPYLLSLLFGSLNLSTKGRPG